VAGYNLLNEPTDDEPGCPRLLAFYTRLAAAVRAVDPDHILCFDGNTFVADFRDFQKSKFTCPNAIFSCHDYSMFGFPIGQAFTGSEADKRKVRSSYCTNARWSSQKRPVLRSGMGNSESFTPHSSRKALNGKRSTNSDMRRLVSSERCTVRIKSVGPCGCTRMWGSKGCVMPDRIVCGIPSSRKGSITSGNMHWSFGEQTSESKHPLTFFTLGSGSRLLGFIHIFRRIADHDVLSQ